MKKNKIDIGNSSLELSQIILGSSDYLKLDNMEKVDKMFTKYVEAGGNTFDTARHYRESESVIGRWLKGKNRSNFNIITKCCHPVRENPDTPRVNSISIKIDLETSLEMLQTEYVDILLLHRDDPDYPVSSLMETLSGLVDEGKIKAFGVSNWKLDRIKEAVRYCRENNLNPLSINSPNFSLATVNIPRWKNCITADDEMINWHKDENFPLVSWSSQAEGFFSHRFKKIDRADSNMKEFVDVYFNDLNWKRLTIVDELAKDKNVKPIQISLAYVLNQVFPTSATIGPEEEWQLEDSIEAMRLELTVKEIDRLKKGE